MANSIRRLKLATSFPVPQSHEEANQALMLIGIHQRERERIELEMNERLAAIKAEYEHRAEPHRRTIEEQIKGLRAWCEAHREHLLSGDTKTYRFGAGEVSWRIRPPRVGVRDTINAIAWFAQNAMAQFIRQREELNKEEILRAPGEAARNPFVKIGSAGEEFYVRPFETELEEVA